MEERTQQVGHFGYLDAIIHVVALQGADGHIRIEGIIRILYDGDAASPFDLYQARCAVIEQAGQNDADDSRAIGFGSRPKKRIDCGPGEVLLGPAA